MTLLLGQERPFSVLILFQLFSPALLMIFYRLCGLYYMSDLIFEFFSDNHRVTNLVTLSEAIEWPSLWVKIQKNLSNDEDD